MEFLINHEVVVEAPPEPHDIHAQRLHVKIDGVERPVQEGPVGHKFEIDGKTGQAVEAVAVNVSSAGVEKQGEPLKFTIVDNVVPPDPGRPKVVATSKKFPAGAK